MLESNAAERWQRLMDETVLEVFAAMLGCECVPTEPAGAPSDNTARVRFSGALVGECLLLFAAADAAKLAHMFLGEAADDEMAIDAIGELCNVLAGGWKRRLRPPASGAGLSVPSSAFGTPDSRGDLRQCYQFEGAQFAVRLTVKRVKED
ncbi:MAG TPA: chemotaxis protein CheX [Acidobacteriaceae bacterium]|nr:chemotaxis protein CheX [Acidobacteriaceae bacterium]